MIPALVIAWQAVVADTSILTFAEFQRRVATTHPVVRQARLLDSLTAGRERAAQGAFDPHLSTQWDRKRFGGKTYFDYLDAELNIPTAIGADFTLGFERTRGSLAAPDRATPATGLFTVGVSLPIGQRLVTDERRVALAQARALREVAAGERDAMVNKLMATSAAAYADWYEAQQRQRLATEGVRLAMVRMDAVRARVRQGDAAAIDTIEVGLEVGRRQIALREADLVLRNATIVVEGMLWDDRGRPVDLPVNTRAAVTDADDLLLQALDAPTLVEAARRHPEVRKAMAKVREEAAARRLALQRSVIPDIKGKVAALGSKGGAPGLDEADAKVGASASIPLLWRRERGVLDASSARLAQLTTEEALTMRVVGVALDVALNEWRALDDLMSLQGDVVARARQLQEGEDRKFEAGESTLFLVNARERLVLDEEAKRISLAAKRFAALGKLGVALGRPAA